MRITDYYSELMKQSFSDSKGKNYTPLAFMLFLKKHNFYFEKISIDELTSFVYRFYIDNLSFARQNSNLLIKNCSKYCRKDIRPYIYEQLYVWAKNGNGVLYFDETSIYVNSVFNNLTPTEIIMLKTVFDGISQKNFGAKIDYNDSIQGLFSEISINNLTFEEYVKLINNSKFKGRAFECADYCVCCDDIDKANLQAIHIDFNRDLDNPNNSIILCREHARLYYENCFRFSSLGRIIIYKNDVFLDDRMHLSSALVKEKKEYLLKI